MSQKVVQVKPIVQDTAVPTETKQVDTDLQVQAMQARKVDAFRVTSSSHGA